MKTLLLLRHARSCERAAGQTDFARPLDERGRSEASLMGGRLLRTGVLPDIIICSPAVRAAETATLFIEAAGLGSKLLYDERIYEANTDALVEVSEQIEEGVGVALLVGHNPGLSGLLARLTGQERHMRPASLACISFDAGRWSEALAHRQAARARLEWLKHPEERWEE